MEDINDKKVLIADDHPLFLLGLKAAIENIQGFHVIGEAQNVDELYSALEATLPDVVVTDFSMPGTDNADGLRLITTVRHKYPEIPIIVVTILSNEGLIEALYRLGVTRVINKRSLSTELSRALGNVDSNFRMVKSASRHRKTDAGNSLTPKEFDVLRMLAEGLSATEIAGKLNRSKQTISSQKISAMKKLGVTTDGELFEYILRIGL